jgi:hypothetical protein
VPFTFNLVRHYILEAFDLGGAVRVESSWPIDSLKAPGFKTLETTSEKLISKFALSHSTSYTATPGHCDGHEDPAQRDGAGDLLDGARRRAQQRGLPLPQRLAGGLLSMQRCIDL